MPNTDYSTKKLGELSELIQDGEIAMLVTRSLDGSLISRPMETTRVDSNGDIFFFLSTDSRLTEELIENGQVNLSYIRPDAHDFVSVSGVAQLSKDRLQIGELWQDHYLRWIPDGVDDPHLALLKITPLSADHWGTNTALSRIAKLFRYGDSGTRNVHEALREESF